MRSVLISMCLFVSGGMLWSAPVINAVGVTDTIIGRYEKFEATVTMTAVYTNPYDYTQVVLSADFLSPGGETFHVDGFFMQEYTLNETSGALTPSGNGEFRIRFSPLETGTWKYTLHLSDITGSSSYAEQRFHCISSLQASNHGFVRRGVTNYLQFDDGNQYIPIGENIAWQNTNAFLNYNNWIDQLSGANGNFFRLWHAHWGLGIEWKAGQNNFAGLRRYKQTNCKYQDWLYDHCAELGVYVQLCIQHHGQVSSGVDPNWNDCPYNAANGGPCQNTWDFFTGTEAKAHTKNRLRYIVARWGYARSILSWELFNEVDWTDNFTTHRQDVADWHAEMATYLKSIDPYGRLITTSYARDTYEDQLWEQTVIDYTQTHFYINNPHLERALVGGVRRYLENFDKPTLTGEFGLGGSASLSQTDPDGVYLHNSMWATLFGGGMGAGMSWWWDNYIHPNGLYTHFNALSKVAERTGFIEYDLKPETTQVSGAPGDLVFTPTLGWGDIGDLQVTVDANGALTPENPRLGAYLYGAQWNTQYRSPPTFSLIFPESSAFAVQTGSDTGTDPRITITLDGSVMLDQPATVNTQYTINVPAGLHVLKVDNTGTDWITIASYTFENAGSQIDPYVLVGTDRNALAGWMLNVDYNHVHLATEGMPEPATGGMLHINNINNGDYLVRWFDCNTGELISSNTLSVTNGAIDLNIPPVTWDLAFTITPDGGVLVKDVLEPVNITAYPNPVRAGEALTLGLSDPTEETFNVVLLDMHGRLIIKGQVNTASAMFAIPESLSSGYYLIQISTRTRAVTIPVAVMNN